MIAQSEWCPLSNVRQLRRKKTMINSHTVTTFDNTDELPLPETVSIENPSAIKLPRPISSAPNTADSGRISFGAGFRLASK
jgi:hypothetical protein